MHTILYLLFLMSETAGRSPHSQQQQRTMAHKAHGKSSQVRSTLHIYDLAHPIRSIAGRCPHTHQQPCTCSTQDIRPGIIWNLVMFLELDTVSAFH
jgi:hypothetical protein